MRVPPRRRHEGHIPRAEKFGDLITADHKVLNEGSESRNNHRYAVVVQDLATQLIQSYPCKTKTSQETEKSLRKVEIPLFFGCLRRSLNSLNGIVESVFASGGHGVLCNATDRGSLKSQVPILGFEICFKL